MIEIEVYQDQTTNKFYAVVKDDGKVLFKTALFDTAAEARRDAAERLAESDLL